MLPQSRVAITTEVSVLSRKRASTASSQVTAGYRSRAREKLRARAVVLEMLLNREKGR